MGEQNESTGLEYLRARYYDPDIGRFISQDPLPLMQRYVYGIGPSTGSGEHRIARINGSTEEYYVADGLGSTTALTDDTGSVSDTYEYDVFGNIRAETGSSDNEFTYTGLSNR